MRSAITGSLRMIWVASTVISGVGMLISLFVGLHLSCMMSAVIDACDLRFGQMRRLPLRDEIDERYGVKEE